MEHHPRHRLTRGVVHVLLAVGFVALFVLAFPGTAQSAVPTVPPLLP